MLTPGGSGATQAITMPAQFTPNTEFATSPLSAHSSSEPGPWQERYGSFSQTEHHLNSWPKMNSDSASSSESKPLKRYSACHTCR